jgi:tripartite-type tricarboxylate transporter receptor subunit TctC
MLGRRGAMIGAGAMLATAAQGQSQTHGSWPDRPVRLLVGFSAGGPTDFAARILQEPLQQLWGQTLVIENKPGASQMIAAEAVAKSAPDGYTLFLCTSTLTANPAVFTKVPYDTIRDFTPIVIIYSSPTVLFTGLNQPYRNVQDVIAAAKREPGLAASTSGVATAGHFATEMFMRAAGIELTHVPYRGAAQALQDVMAGRVPVTFSTLAGAIALARDGKLRPIAIAGPHRVSSFPDVPTMAEQGIQMRETAPWYSFMGPAGLPQAITDRIVRDVQGLLKRPDIIRRIEESGGVVEGEGPAEFTARIPREIAINMEVARVANIHID